MASHLTPKLVATPLTLFYKQWKERSLLVQWLPNTGLQTSLFDQIWGICSILTLSRLSLAYSFFSRSQNKHWGTQHWLCITFNPYNKCMQMIVIFMLRFLNSLVRKETCHVVRVKSGFECRLGWLSTPWVVASRAPPNRSVGSVDFTLLG